MKILVLGDAFCDRYHLATTSRLSAEAPIPICKIERSFDLPGGALNVRENLRRLGVDGRFLVPSGDVNLPIKNRLVVGDHQLARWDENDFCTPYKREDLLVLLEEWDGIIVSDYSKGSITQEVIQILREVSLPMFVDTKTNPTSWIGSEAVMFPNLSEYKTFQQSYEWFGKVLLKRSAEGIALVEYGNVVLQRPALASLVRSVNGAGDTAMAAFVVSILGGANMDFALEYSMAAAAVSVEHPYTYAPTEQEVLDKLTEIPMTSTDLEWTYAPTA
jgi:bifunctional ADP-heptose synthase (sugar kinase/adenylyltransferase)